MRTPARSLPIAFTVVFMGILQSGLFGDELPVLWEPRVGSLTMADVICRLPKNTQAFDPDPITYAHEGNHFLCRGGNGSHKIYVGGGRRWEIPTPPLKTLEVFARLPKEGTLWDTYRSQGSHEYWQGQPLMILDEWRAYTVGAQVRQELGIEKRAETVRHAETFSRWAAILYQMSKAQKGYDASQMREFCNWNLIQCRLVDGFKSDVEFE